MDHYKPQLLLSKRLLQGCLELSEETVIDPKRARDVLKDRISAAMEALSRIIRGNVRDRGEARQIVEEVYRSRALQPIRGKAWPPDIWDKELATLYTIARYALGLDRDYPDIFHNIFSVEEMLEKAGEAVLESNDIELARKLLLFYLGGKVDSNTVARLLRVFATEVIFGFRSEREFEELLRKLVNVLPEETQTIRKYARYYIALRLAQAIAARLIKNRIAKEALKQALAARIGFEKILPDDEYVSFIARSVFSVDKRKLEKILSLKKAQPRVHRPSSKTE
ncbi:MAG TPA: DUF2192 domain-containing protein [Pyrodictium sp.]|nr:DUF2192 domain-containing protein [Pyrodictium sp.]HIQ55560.1 DUF2192 domain-containing protein [Pyrodictium sp.]